MTTKTLGFLGTGTIASAIIKGLCKKENDYQIIVSPRNAEIAAQLQKEFPTKVTIAPDNQTVLDQAEIVFIALRFQVAEEIIRSLEFKDTHKIVNLIATASNEKIKEWIPNHCQFHRAVPLPFVENEKSVTPFFPADQDIQSLFDQLGGGVAVENEAQFNAFMIAGSFMGVYYHFIDVCNTWLKENGLQQEQTAPYLAKLFSNLSDEALINQNFPELEREYSTKGGTNEFISQQFTANHGDKTLKDAFDKALSKINQK